MINLYLTASLTCENVYEANAALIQDHRVSSQMMNLANVTLIVLDQTIRRDRPMIQLIHRGNFDPCLGRERGSVIATRMFTV